MCSSIPTRVVHLIQYPFAYPAKLFEAGLITRHLILLGNSCLWSLMVMNAFDLLWHSILSSISKARESIGKEFFKLLQLHFPKQHPLHSIFNKNTVKLSYSCTTNMDNIVKAHNAKILLNDDKMDEEERGCNCRDKAACPVANKCQKTNVVYKATVEYEDKTEHYIGMTENSFKTRYTLHKSSLRHSKNRNQTELSNLIWSLKNKGTDYNLT